MIDSNRFNKTCLTNSKNMDDEDTKEELLQRHKEEKKELQSQITKLKHSVSKGDKKGKKAVQEQISQLEKDLKERHDKELRKVEEASLAEPEKVYILTPSHKSYGETLYRYMQPSSFIYQWLPVFYLLYWVM